MCDYFWQRMENDHGDLADIVRTGGRGSPPNAELDPVEDWQLPYSDPAVFFPARTEAPASNNSFGDPFVDLRDPLLNQLYAGAPELFDGAETMAAPATMAMASSSGGERLLAAPKVLSGEQEINRPCNIFSRVLQISPGGGIKPSPLSPRLIKPSPLAAGEMMKVSGGSMAGPVDHGGGLQISSPRTPGIKRRKSQAKKVMCIPAPAAASNRPSGEVVPSDLWAWRKYGQKPIKGSPYPRGYYRCSSSKGCPARKQVERSRTDPNMLVITYTSEHNHPWPTQRNALAGSIRSHPSKNASKSSNDAINLKSLKEEPKEQLVTSSSSAAAHAVKEEEVNAEMEKTLIIEQGEEAEFDQIIHQSYKPMIPEADQPDDFFADLAELEADPVSLIFSKGFMQAKPDEERGDKAALDPFNMFDWAGSS